MLFSTCAFHNSNATPMSLDHEASVRRHLRGWPLGQCWGVLGHEGLPGVTLIESGHRLVRSGRYRGVMCGRVGEHWSGLGGRCCCC